MYAGGEPAAPGWSNGCGGTLRILATAKGSSAKGLGVRGKKVSVNLLP